MTAPIFRGRERLAHATKEKKVVSYSLLTEKKVFTHFRPIGMPWGGTMFMEKRNRTVSAEMGPLPSKTPKEKKTVLLADRPKKREEGGLLLVTEESTYPLLYKDRGEHLRKGRKAVLVGIYRLGKKKEWAIESSCSA